MIFKWVAIYPEYTDIKYLAIKITAIEWHI
jgi:hypothetical protein